MSELEEGSRIGSEGEQKEGRREVKGLEIRDRRRIGVWRGLDSEIQRV